MSEIIPPSFMLQKKVGGSAARLITPEAVARAQDNVDLLRTPIQREVARLLEEIARAARVRDIGAHDFIWSRAHEIRGLAGSAKRVRLGQICNILCHYLNDTQIGFKPDANLITKISVAALHTLHDNSDEDAAVAQLVDDCSLAASRQKILEGRGELS